ncbi:aldo/keto reductase [Microbacterium sp.]|uniref:aldo/keto reductase n=1 Tax=Microbacterium sp. TaxID=51671 RepID=UPI0027342AA8|nr:aldo/keto reductase [Microbacterium sp.]MDP3952318.1 aldo/keto reductase [Microbacterium sp.]
MAFSNESDHGALVLGTSSLGARGVDEAALETARALIGSGLRIDTSNAYADGRSERVLGLALAKLDSAERDVAASRVITKVDRDPDTGVFDASRVRRSCEESLERLGVDHISLLHLHDPYTVTVDEAFGPGGAVEGLLQLKQEGIVDAIGIAAGPVPLVRRYVDSGAFDAVLCHNRFTLVDRSASDLFAAAKDLGMTVFNAAPFGGDLLVRGPRPDARYDYRPIGDALRRWTAGFFRVCTSYDISPAAAALRPSTISPIVDHTVVGVSSPQRIAELLTAHSENIPDALWSAIDALGPVPSPIDDTEYEGA